VDIQLKNGTLHYEVEGENDPIIMLHGNTESLDIFNELSSRLIPYYKVYRIDSRYHGKSSHQGNLTYDVLRDDLFDFINALNIKKPHIIGFSDGGIVALMLEIKHPKTAASLMLLGINTRPKGLKFRVLKIIQHKFRNTKNRYDKLMLTGPYLKKSDLRTVKTPVLLVTGSKDLITKRHTHMINRQLFDSKLLIMEGYQHEDYIVHNDVLHHDLLSFLNTIKKRT